MKHNPQRGEVTIVGPEDEEYTLCLTLGAIAQIEDSLDIDSLADIGEVLEKPSMKNINNILVAMLNGGGHGEITSKDLMKWKVKLPDLMEAIKACFEASGFNDDEEDSEGDNSSGK